MDKIVDSLKNKRFVFWEEIARDGAQAKTILSGKQRVELAKMHANMFGENGPDHLVFAAGFISIGEDEVRAIKTLADEVDNCYLAVNCRSSKNEISDSLNALKNAKYGRVAFVMPISERMCQLMLHKSPREVLTQGIDMAKYAVDQANGIPVDVQLAASFDADPEFIAEVGSKLKEQGIAIAHLGDTRGRLYPAEVKTYMESLLKHSDDDQLYGVHFHNDLAFALDNNLECIKQNVTLAASSWMGLAERNGLVNTELLSFHLTYQAEKIIDRFGFEGKDLFITPPDLKKLKPIAQKVSKFTGVELKVTDPIVGTGVNSISTGTPFVDTKSFQPFDPEKVLGIDRTMLITQLASGRVIREVADLLGYKVTDDQVNKILVAVKKNAYRKNRSIIPEKKLFKIFNKVVNR